MYGQTYLVSMDNNSQNVTNPDNMSELIAIKITISLP